MTNKEKYLNELVEKWAKWSYEKQMELINSKPEYREIYDKAKGMAEKENKKQFTS